MRTKRLGLLAAVLATVAVILLASVPASAQTVANSTTLSADITGVLPGGTSPARVFTVASTSNIVAGSILVVDAEEMMVEEVIVSGIVRVQRGYRSRAMAHRSGATAFIVPSNQVTYFLHDVDPEYSATCTRGTGQAAYLPWINLQTGVHWSCAPTGYAANRWRGDAVANIAYGSDPSPPTAY